MQSVEDWDIIDFWFGPLAGPESFPEDRAKLWFGKDAAFDNLIKSQFEYLLEAGRAGQLNHWKATPRGTLSLIILYDQFPRNIYRGSRAAFADDERALQYCLNGLAQDFDLELRPVERVFFYLPLEHAEDRLMQEASVARFQRLCDEAPKVLWEKMDSFLDFAKRHKAVIDRFGRFPHRNAAMGRASTPDELEYLKTPGSGF